MNRKFISKLIEQSGSFDTYARLRRLALDLAIRGAFDDERGVAGSAEQIEKQIRLAIEVNRKQGKGRATSEKLGPVREEERLPQYAQHRHFVRIGDIAVVSKGLTGIKDAKPGAYPLVVTAEARGTCDHFDFEGPGVVIPMVSSTGHGDASLKRIHYQEGRYAVGTILSVLQPIRSDLISARFLYEYLSAFKDELLVSRMIGTANVSLTISKVAEIPVPLVSINAQNRVYQLMKLCDDLEQNGRLADEQHARLTSTLFDALTASESAHALAENWQRFAENFDLLLDRPEAVDALEQTILQLAVRGLLVPQDPEDEPASVLLKEIRAEKDRLIAEGKIKHDKPLPLTIVEEMPFDLPQGWEWVRLGQIAGIERGGSPRPIEAFLTNDASGINWIKIGDTEIGGKYITSANQKIKPEGLVKTRKVYPGDFLLTNSMSFGRPYITQIEGCIHDGWLRISPPDSLDKNYLYDLLSSSFIRGFFSAAAAGGVVLNLNADKVRGVAIPLPPLAEQSRIVARVESLRRLCADLRQRLSSASERQSQLAQALVEQQATATV